MTANKTKNWAERLKEIRLKRGISQRKLGIAAGLDPSVASTRINRYEKDIHSPDHGMSQRIAEALNIPNAFLYAEDDELAELIELYSLFNTKQKKELFKLLKSIG